MENSNPARDFLTGIQLLGNTSGITLAEKICTQIGSSENTREFYMTVKLLQELLDQIQSDISADDDLPTEDREFYDGEIGRLRGMFSLNGLSTRWEEHTLPGRSFGPEATTFLRSASSQLRIRHSYRKMQTEDCKLIIHAVECIRSDMVGVQLDSADFAREALLRGCEEVSFIVSNIDLFGFSRLIGPVMELSAFLYTISSEVHRKYGDYKKIKRSANALQSVVERMKEYAGVVNAANALANGAVHLLDFFKDK